VFEKEAQVLIDLLNNFNVCYIVVKTKFTTHHIEKLLASCKDRGTIKWIAETETDAWEHMSVNEEARRSHIDGGDIFPRLYFLPTNFVSEFLMWCKVRNLAIQDISAPIGYQRGEVAVYAND
jgi:hypothetical protein